MTALNKRPDPAEPKRHEERIALIMASMRGGGAERAVAKLASGFARRGYAVDLVLAKAEGPFLAELHPEVQVVDLGVKRVATAVVPLARYLRAKRPAVAFSALNYVNVAAVVARALARVDVPLVVSERNTLSVATANTPRRRNRWMPRLMRWTYPRASAVVAVSQGVAEDLVEMCGLASESVVVLNNPVVTPEMARMRTEPVTHPWLQERTCPTILAVGRLIPQKDFATLIEAFATVRRARPARLVILGRGPLQSELEQLAARLGVAADVSLPGFCDNPYPAMSAADVFALSSRWEGSPGVLIEAISCGATVVSTDCPSGPHQILDGGRYGALVPVGDAAAMAAALVDALDGRVPPPPRESWLPYEQEQVVTSYLDVLLKTSRS
ncbi:MAG TPA: glycosyltransferase [Nocardioidaceae bacterium]|nr:glycosyltransferase [Nocardioidaceae bacterium]